MNLGDPLLLEPLLWWIAGATVLFAAVYALSRSAGSRYPRVMQILWLLFFMKLVIPVGLWSPVVHFAVSDPSPNPVAIVLGSPDPVREGAPVAMAPAVVSGMDSRAPLSPVVFLVVLWAVGALVFGALTLVAYQKAATLPTGPLAVGILSPRIVLPEGFEDRFTPLERELVVAHETAHLRVGDPLWLVAVQIVTVAFWWFLPVWWARREFLIVTELACDAAVLRSRTTAEARVYGHLLLRLASAPVHDVGAAFAGTYGGLRRRLTALVPRRFGAFGLVLVLLGGTGLGALSLTPRAGEWAWPLPPEIPGAVGPSSNAALPGELVLEAVPGTLVRAAADGVVDGRSDRAGGTLVVDHGDGYLATYRAVDGDPALTPGTRVVRGQSLGTVRGLATYSQTDVLPALRFSVSRNDTPVDLGSLFPEVNLLLHPDFGDVLVWPLGRSKGFQTSRFGIEVHPWTGRAYFHKGVDWATLPGTPVHSVAGGRVIETGYDDLGEGWYIEVDHGKGRTSRYSHLRVEPLANQGQSVASGQVLGEVGATGLATGPHLHWELKVDGRVVDPMRVASATY